jgi:alkyl sulfatase BDS1-like metallo-beta-lactamase superfamily hydrolase
MRKIISCSAACVVSMAVLFLFACPKKELVIKQAPVPVTDLIKEQVEIIGEPRIERVSEHVWAAISYDLASVVLINTNDGVVIIDPLMSPLKARSAKEAFEKAGAPGGKVRAIIYTHSHADHIGGASVWADDGVQIWATDTFQDHLLKQYQKFLPAETMRGRRQSGYNISKEDLPVMGIGPRQDMDAAMNSGVRLPTHTFSGARMLTIGGLEIELNEAPGETHDQLFVWVPADKTLIAGDNFYFTFPNLYTIRGSSPRPVDEWIISLDKMRMKEPEHLIPNHTRAVHGRDDILAALTNYRDAIQWVRDETVRGANKGMDVDELAATIKLPPRLADLPYTREFYGQVDWSVRAIYTNNLGWFDGRAETLYPLERPDSAAREVKLMGGPDKVMNEAEGALQADDAKWAIHLLAKLKDSGLFADSELLDDKLVLAYEALAARTHNLNGRGYLLQSAYELKHGVEKPTDAKLDPEMVQSLPLESIFSIMVTRLIPEKTMDVHESVCFIFPDEDKKIFFTIRYGIGEMSIDKPLPGTPEPVATLITSGKIYRKIAVENMNPALPLAKGELKIEGSWLKFVEFLGMFDRPQ